MKFFITSRFSIVVESFLTNGNIPACDYGKAKRFLRREIAYRVAAVAASNTVLAILPRPIAPEEISLPRPYPSAIPAPFGLLQFHGVLHLHGRTHPQRLLPRVRGPPHQAVQHL
jgi:hypothetical protein